VNSSFWDAKIARNRQRDTDKVAVLESLGIRSLRLWEHELRENPGKCIARLRELLAQGFEPGENTATCES
jgi:DNA mismatch endonuclease, patch repair protein